MHVPTPTLPRQGIQLHLADPGLVRSEMFLDGRWQPARSGALQPVRNPATGEWLGSVPAGAADETRKAIEAARNAWPAWRARTPDERGAILRRWGDLMRAASDDLAVIMTLEQGKPLRESCYEIGYAAAFLDWFAEEGRRAYGDTIPSHRLNRRLLTLRQSIGVTAAITPWNFPSAMITRKAGAALAAGCPMIVRPASETPFSALALAVLAERAGVPPGVLAVVTGDARLIAGELTGSNAVRSLSFTGSTDVGRLLLRQSADTVRKVSLELGGHAPFIVFEDVNVERAAALAIGAKFATSGQDCLAANRILVQRRIYPQFVEAFASLTRKLRVGPGLEPDVDIGPLISEKAIAHCEAQIADALHHGASLRTGGRRHETGALFLAPTVLADITREMAIWNEETFGPVAALAPFDTEEEAVGLANDTEYGLAAYLCTNDLGRALRVGEALEYGMVAVNTDSFTGPPIPFGGVKQSGLGREGSRYGLDEYMEIKYLCLSTEAI